MKFNIHTLLLLAILPIMLAIKQLYQKNAYEALLWFSLSIIIAIFSLSIYWQSNSSTDSNALAAILFFTMLILGYFTLLKKKK